jgi:hypothetical protein
MKRLTLAVTLTLALAGCLGWMLIHPQHASAAPDSHVGSFLTTITVAGTGAFASQSVITLHDDHTMSSIDSGQGGPAALFSSQLGAWESKGNDPAEGRTVDFSFPNAGSARVDYTFNPAPAGTISGTIVLTVFPPNTDPLDGGGTVVGNFNFTGRRITVP